MGGYDSIMEGNLPFSVQEIALKQYEKDWEEIIVPEDIEKMKEIFHSLSDENKLSFYDKAIFIKQLTMSGIDNDKANSIFNYCLKHNISDAPDIFNNEDAEKWLLERDDSYLSIKKFDQHSGLGD